MTMLTRPMPSVEGVAAGQTATLRLPRGFTYAGLLFTYAGVLADYSEVRILANGEQIMRYNGFAEIDSVNQYEGLPAASGVLRLDFERPKLITRDAREVTQIGTGVEDDPRRIDTLEVQIDIIGTPSTTPSLDVSARLDGPSKSGLIRKVKRFNYNPAASGEFQISDLPKNGVINRVIFASADVNKLKVERDNFLVFDRTAAENDLIQSSYDRVPQSGYFVFDPSEAGYGSEGLSTQDVQDLRFTADMAAGGSLPVLVEYIEPLQR